MTNQEDDSKYLVKLIVIGSSGVGKSSLLLRYAMDTFKEDTRTTIGVDFKHKKLKVEGESVNCQIWDTAGQDRFSCISKEYYRGANGCLLVYDITDDASFNKIDHWYQELLTYAHTAEDPVTVIVGNKCDLKNQSKNTVKSEDAMNYAKSHNMMFFETSAKLNFNVEEAFKVLVEDIVHRMKKSSLVQKNELAKTDSIRLEPEVSLEESEQQAGGGDNTLKKKEESCRC